MLALKLFLVPLILALVSLVARWRGPALAGWLAGFPIIAAPVLLLVSLENGPLFAADAALGAVNMAPANAAFCLGYAMGATRFRWWQSLSLGLLAYMATGAVLVRLEAPPLLMLASTLVGLWLVSRSFPTGRVSRVPAVHTARDVVVRMLAGTALVLAVTLAAPLLGPRVSGLLSGFPILACVLSSSSHRTQGAGFAITLLHSMISGFYAMVFFFATLALALPYFGISHGFLLAYVVAGVVQAISLWLRSVTPRPE